MAKIEVFTMVNCPYCVRAKRLLELRGVPYQEILVPLDDDAQWDALAKRSGGMQTVPQIYHDGKIVGGYTELAELDEKDQLRSLLS